MKRTVTAITITLLVLLAASCGKDKVQPDYSVTLSVSIDNGTSPAGTIAIPEGHKLRYIVEAWDAETPANLILREEKIADTGENVEFAFQLPGTSDYKALLWADFIKENTGTSVEVHCASTGDVTFNHYADLYYNTLNLLTAVAIRKAGTGYKVNDSARDTFCASLDIKKEYGACRRTVTLTRPFGRLYVANNDMVSVAATFAYSVPRGFNVATGTPAADLVAVNPTVAALATETGLLLEDYIFAPLRPAHIALGEIVMTLAGGDSFTVPADIPVERDRNTAVIGNILYLAGTLRPDVNLSVSVTAKEFDLYIPDVSFRRICIMKGYADNEGYIIKEKAAVVTELNVDYQNIWTLKGIEYFTGLTTLCCNGNLLATLDLAGRTGLTRLECHFNQILALDLTECPALTKLACGNNPIAKLDVAGRAALTTLYCNKTRIATLDLTGCTALTILDCSEAGIAALDASTMADPADYDLVCGKQTGSDGNDQSLSLILHPDQRVRWEEIATRFENKNVNVNYKSD
ncbi:DUF6562 domain-containing protein [Butyricimonas hominis]|uniref:DUF6562 domain-containing protein n=1 Tax=Butyricimonas hominis TaxID=2763032 RepID=UPI003515759F